MGGELTIYKKSLCLIALGLIVNHHYSPNLGPAVHPLCSINGHIHAAGAHRCAEVVVPPGAMDAVALVEVHYPRYVPDVISGSGHILQTYFCPNTELPRHGGGAGSTGGDNKTFHKVGTIVNGQSLIGEIDVDPALAILQTAGQVDLILFNGAGISPGRRRWCRAGRFSWCLRRFVGGGVGLRRSWGSSKRCSWRWSFGGEQRIQFACSRDAHKA